VNRIALLAGVIVLAGCGSTKHVVVSTKPAPLSPSPSPAAAMRALLIAPGSASAVVKTLYEGTSWSVVEETNKGHALAEAFELLGGHWKPDTTGNVKIEILGPQPHTRAAKMPQVAIAFTAPAPFVESAIWVDGKELLEKGGGSPTRGTIYGAPAKNLAPGLHVAVGYARTATTGTAVAWVFRV
jgi:hypothetical protein